MKWDRVAEEQGKIEEVLGKGSGQNITVNEYSINQYILFSVYRALLADIV